MKYHNTRRSSALAIVALLLTLAAHTSVAAERVALVIGNASYPEDPLDNPVNDARAMSARLSDFGFEVTTVLDADLKAM